MKRYILIISLGLLSCEKETTTPQPTTCECYQLHETIGAGGSWNYSHQTQPQPELCEKDEVIVISPSGASRYTWKCN
jgi:hypothetical protein